MQPSRYDDHAGWFVDYSHSWSATSLPYLAEDLAGVSVLDLACGWGPLSRELADRGARVTGVELSEPLLERARGLEAADPRGIRYVRGDATERGWWDGEPFDGVVCNMALMDIDDLAGAVATVATVLQPGGWFNVSLLHPCFPGEARPDGDTLPSWPPDRGYASEGWWSTGSSGVRGHVGAHHRTLSTYLNALLDAGLRLTRVHEPDAGLPRILVLEGHRPTAEQGDRP